MFTGALCGWPSGGVQLCSSPNLYGNLAQGTSQCLTARPMFSNGLRTNMETCYQNSKFWPYRKLFILPNFFHGGYDVPCRGGFFIAVFLQLLVVKAWQHHASACLFFPLPSFGRISACWKSYHIHFYASWCISFHPIYCYVNICKWGILTMTH